MIGEAARAFADHFSAVADRYADARPEYPPALFEWIASIAPGTALAWEAGCGSGQASRGLAPHFLRVHATDPSAAQIARARAPANVDFAVEPAEACSLAAGSADAACVAQALHWFEAGDFFAECMRVLRPAGVLVAWGYQDIEVPAALAEANEALQDDIRAYWPPERALVDEGYTQLDWPFAPVAALEFEMRADWPLERLLGYYGSYSASRRCLEATGTDPVARHVAAFREAWPESRAPVPVRWPLFVHARRKAGG